MPIGKPARTPCEEYTHILSTLDHQLVRLDRAGAHKAAAHLDAAIQQLRRDKLALELASSAGEHLSEIDRKTTISTAKSASKLEVSPLPHVVARKAKPANAR